MSLVRICLERGCTERVVDGSYCPEHDRERVARRTRARVEAKDPRQTYRWRQLIRPRVLRRDHYRCTRCGSTENLTVDHVDGDPNNCAMSNLRTHCRSCNAGPARKEQITARRASKTWPPR